MNIDVKTKKNYSFGALQKKLSGIVITTLNSLANNLNADLQKGIDTGRDINNAAKPKQSPFATLLGKSPGPE